MKTEERKLQIEVVNWFRERVANMIPRPLIYSNHNNASNSASGNLAMLQGRLAGVSDLTIMLSKKHIYLELKSAKGKLSKAQKKFRDDVSMLGHEYFCTNSLEEVQNIINNILTQYI